MAQHLAGSEWHMDRIDEARFLVREIERLTAQLEDEGDEGAFIETRYCDACGELLIGAETCTTCTPAPSR